MVYNSQQSNEHTRDINQQLPKIYIHLYLYMYICMNIFLFIPELNENVYEKRGILSYGNTYEYVTVSVSTRVILSLQGKEQLYNHKSAES